MKKLIALLILVALGGVAIAQDGQFPIVAEKEVKPVTIDSTSIDYVQYAPANYVDYTIIKKNESPDAAQLYFTTKKEVTFKIWQDIDKDDSTASNYDAFTGYSADDITTGINLSIKEYGIYRVNDKGEKSGEWQPLGSGTDVISEAVTLDADTNFGVYYQKNDGTYVTTTDNWVGLSYDDDDHITDYNNYDETKYNPLTTANDHRIMTSEKFFCLFQGEAGGLPALEREHWEAMFLTDKPITTVGQPLPGTLATIMIGGLCAAALRRKKTKKN